MIYLIGGPARVGKTQTVKAVIKQRPMASISSDAVRYMLRRTLPDTPLNRRLWSSNQAEPLTRSPAELLEDQNEESQALWPALVKIMESYNLEDKDLLIEGVAILPELVRQLPFDSRVIILSNASKTHREMILRQARSNPNDWLNNKPDTIIEHYCSFFEYMDTWLRSEAKKYDINSQSIDDAHFPESLAAAATQLIKY
jgi:2-phosphoglycerate kinase